MSKSRKTPKFIDSLAQKRAEAMLTLDLAPRGDLALQSIDEDYGYYIARILKNGSLNTNRMFGIDLKSVVETNKGPEVSISPELVDWYSESATPLCLFYYVMREDVGYFAWIVRPEISKSAGPILVLNERLRRDTRPSALKPKDFSEVNSDTLNALVHDVNAWYDAVRRIHREAA